MSHGQHGHTRLTTARTWGEVITFPLIVYSVANHRAYIQMAFLSRDSRVGVSKSRRLGLPRLWSPITLRVDLGLRCSLKQSCSSCQNLSNDMLHALYNQVNWVDSRLFLVGNQTLGPSFGHNLCFKCSNEQHEPSLNIYVPRAFQWYKEYDKPLSFDPWNRSLKFQDSISQNGSCFGSVRVHSFTLSSTPLHSREYVMWLPNFFLAHNLVTPLSWSRAQS